jgi:DNA-3-methyladenine glycosylase I
MRCEWAGEAGSAMAKYHDSEWGSPSLDDVHLFELLTLEGAQAGLSWSTILNKRDGYRRAFAGFDAAKVARFGSRRVAELLSDGSIVRNRLKIESTIANARAIEALGHEGVALHELLWSFVGGRPIVNKWKTLSDLPAKTAESDAMSKGLKKAGFRFVGPTVCYSLMQAAGLVNDHVVGCEFRFPAR